MPYVRVEFDRDGPLPAPEGANFFHFTHIQGEVEMLVGYVDLNRLWALSQDYEDASDEEELPSHVSVKPEITHRLVLSANGFKTLKDRVDQIWSTMVRADSDAVDEGSSP